MSNGDVEDVLTSVRRLVSQDPSDPVLRPAVQELSSEKLLLTPALRVHDAPGEVTPEPDVGGFGPDHIEPDEGAERAGERIAATSEAPFSAWSLEDRIAELEAAVGAQPDEWEPDGSEVGAEDTPHSIVFQHSNQSEIPDLPDVDAEAEAPEVGLGSEPIAFPGPARAANDGSEPEVLSPFARIEAAAPDPFLATVEPFAPIGTRPDGDEPRAGGVEDPMIDEEVLRDMVADIVREELQGALGERITRNVRKLVRREIHRAIMTRDFD